MILDTITRYLFGASQRKPKSGSNADLPRNISNRPPLDLSQFNDPVAEQTDWSPLARPIVLRCFMPAPVKVGASRLELRNSPLDWFKAVGLGAINCGLGAFLFRNILKLLETGTENILQTIILLIIFGAGSVAIVLIGLATGSSVRPLVVDKRHNRIWKRWSIGRRSAKQGGLPRILSDVHAIQLLSRSFSTVGNTRCFEYDVNLVCLDRCRIPLWHGRDLDAVRSAAQELANFLERPLWDAAEVELPLSVPKRTPHFRIRSISHGMRMTLGIPQRSISLAKLAGFNFFLLMMSTLIFKLSILGTVVVVPLYNLAIFNHGGKEMLQAFLTESIDIIGQTLLLNDCFLGIPFRTKIFQLNELADMCHSEEGLVPSKNAVVTMSAGTALRDVEPVREALTKVLTDILRFQPHSVEHIVFGGCDKQPFSQKGDTLLNPDVTELTTPFVHLKRIDINTASYDYARVERFLTYAVNYMDRRYLSKHVDVYVYEEDEALPANLYNNLNTLCRKVSVSSRM